MSRAKIKIGHYVLTQSDDIVKSDFIKKRGSTYNSTLHECM